MECRASSAAFACRFEDPYHKAGCLSGLSQVSRRSRPMASDEVKETQISQPSRPGQLHPMAGA